MKQLLLSIALLALLTACSADTPLPRVSEQDVSSVAQQDLSSADLSEYQLTDFDFLFTSSFKLSQLGVDVKIVNVKSVEENKLSYELFFVNRRGDSMKLPYTAHYRRATENFGSHVTWGGVSIVDSQTFAVSDLKNVTFYDIQTLQELPISLDLSAFEGKDYYLLGVAKSDDVGIVVPVLNNNKDGFAYFTETGAFVKFEEINYDTTDFRLLCYYFGDFDINTVSYQTDFLILPMDDTYFLLNGVYLYNMNKNEYFSTFNWPSSINDGDREASVLTYQDLQLGRNALAVFVEDKTNCKSFFFDASKISKSFSKQSGNYINGAVDYIWGSTGSNIQLSCSYSDLSLILDFDNKTASFEYNINPQHLEEEAIAQSSDGRYSLYESSKCYGGDEVFANIVLKDNETQALRFLSTYAGMYGGYLNAGFFKNGEIYVQTLDNFQIFSPDPAVTSPSFVFALPFGSLREEGITRQIYTFRRDPEAKTFIILYSEHPIDIYQAHSYNPFRLEHTYKIGFCDTAGNLLESYDTLEQVQGNEYNLLDMNLWLSGDELAITGLDKAQNKRLQGVFNLKTHTYKNND